jgi:AcrR family transcriptional regulator
MLDAAAYVMRTKGLARATTKEIAKAAGYSEAALYKHFRDKTDLFVAVLNERVPSSLIGLLDSLEQRVGKGSVQRTLEDAAAAAIGFYQQTFPMAASLFSEPLLLAAHRAALPGPDAGPQHVNHVLGRYLAAEQARGRIRSDADPHAAAALLLGACLQHAFLGAFAGTPIDDGATQRVAASLAKTLVGGIAPRVRAR